MIAIVQNLLYSLVISLGLFFTELALSSNVANYIVLKVMSNVTLWICQLIVETGIG